MLWGICLDGYIDSDINIYMSKYYNQYTGYKYTPDQIFEKCKQVTCRKIFQSTGLDKRAKNLGIYDECLRIVDDNNMKLLSEKRKQFLDDIKNRSENFHSISSFLTKYPEYRWAYYQDEEVNRILKDRIVRQKYSSPQLICKKIAETVLNSTCLYNNRSALNGKELDIFFPLYKLAIEYNGFFWHQNKKDNDAAKEQLCNDKGITLITIKELYLNEFTDLTIASDKIKNQFKSHLHIINTATDLSVTETDIDNVKIEDIDLMYQCFNRKDIDYILANCNRYSEIKTKYNKIWQYLLRNKLLHILDPVKKRDYLYMNKEELINWICTNFNTYTDFIHHKVYAVSVSRGVREIVKEYFYNKKISS
jgi:hypothetical protein